MRLGAARLGSQRIGSQRFGSARRWRDGIAVPALFAFAALLTFVSLGTWQMERKVWKEGLIDTLERRLSAAPVALAPREHWADLSQADAEFRRVKFSATFVQGTQALIYAGGSSLRSDIAGPGYWVFAPARLAAGGQVVVNRGFVPEGQRDAASHGTQNLRAGEGPADIVGVMRWPEPRGFFVPSADPRRNLWFVRDQLEIAAAKGWGEVAPFYIDLELPVPPGGLPRAGALAPHLRNQHLQYAITWYALGLVVVAMFAAWVIGNRHASRAQ